MQKYNLGIDFLDKRNDYINEVSLQEVNAAAKKYFKTMPDMVYIGALPKIKEKK
jgi:predicted Zn-dependent peptidase